MTRRSKERELQHPDDPLVLTEQRMMQCLRDGNETIEEISERILECHNVTDDSKTDVLNFLAGLFQVAAVMTADTSQPNDLQMTSSAVQQLHGLVDGLSLRMRYLVWLRNGGLERATDFRLIRGTKANGSGPQRPNAAPSAPRAAN